MGIWRFAGVKLLECMSAIQFAKRVLALVVLESIQLFVKRFIIDTLQTIRINSTLLDFFHDMDKILKS